jgi:hypothetical protein
MKRSAYWTVTSLKELRNEISHMDEAELLAFGRQHRASPDSEEYLEAKAEWKRRQQKKRKYELERQEILLSVRSSWDIRGLCFSTDTHRTTTRGRASRLRTGGTSMF